MPQHTITTLDIAGVPVEVLSGIWRIPLPLPFSLRWVNVYVLHGDNQWVLVDCGLGLPESSEALEAGLRTLGISFADLDALLLTHAHPDHIGIANEIALQMHHGRIIMLDHDMQDMFRTWGNTAAIETIAAFQAAAGVSADDVEDGVREFQLLTYLIHLPPASSIETLQANTTITLAGRVWTVLWTPGHAYGHMSLISEDVVIIGDHVLPTISPNTSLYPNSDSNPIQSHLSSMDLVARQIGTYQPLALPGHGAPFSTLVDRIEVLQNSHLRRSLNVMEIMQSFASPVSPLRVAESVFRHRTLRGTEQRLALGETFAHLEYLRNQDRIEKHLEGPYILYQSKDTV